MSHLWGRRGEQYLLLSSSSPVSLANTLLAYVTQSPHTPTGMYSCPVVSSKQSAGVVVSPCQWQHNDSTSMSHF